MKLSNCFAEPQLDALYEAHKPNAFLKLPHPSNYKLRALVDDGEVILRKLREWEAQRARPKAAQAEAGLATWRGLRKRRHTECIRPCDDRATTSSFGARPHSRAPRRAQKSPEGSTL